MVKLVKPAAMVSATLALLFVVSAPSVSAAPIVLTPGTPGVFGVNLGSSNCEPSCVYSAFGLPNNGSLALLYKQDVGGSESGSFASSYSTAFYNTPSDPADATISYVSMFPVINCQVCYLAIKDGNHQPSYYFYNLAAWNGMDSIVMRNFWPQQGAISHVSIWGISGPSLRAVPEPASMLLLGTGLLALVARRRARR